MSVTFYSILHLLSIILFTVGVTLFYMTDKKIKTWKFHTLLFLILFSGIGLAHKFSIPVIGSWVTVKLSLFVIIAFLIGASKRAPQHKQTFFYITLSLIALAIITAITQPF
jgi:uncharacterized membrane protein SirB2